MSQPTIMKAMKTSAPTSSKLVYVAANTTSATSGNILNSGARPEGFYRFYSDLNSSGLGSTVGLIFEKRGTTPSDPSLTATDSTAATAMIAPGTYQDFWIDDTCTMFKRIASGTDGTFRIVQMGD